MFFSWSISLGRADIMISMYLFNHYYLYIRLILVILHADGVLTCLANRYPCCIHSISDPIVLACCWLRVTSSVVAASCRTDCISVKQELDEARALPAWGNSVY